MIVVLPEPVAPTMRDPLAGRDAERDVAQHPVLAAVGEPDVLEDDLAPHARPARAACAGTGSVSTSSSAKMRSAAVIDDCITAYFALKSRIGTKNCWMYWMNATTVPSSTTLAPRAAAPPSPAA